MKIRLLLPLVLGIASCHNRGGENVDGGACSFRYDSSAIRVVGIEPQGNDTTYDVLFRPVHRDGSLDTAGDPIRYTMTHPNHYITHTEMRKYDIHPGATCIYIERQPISGSCDGGHEVSLEAWRK